MFLSSLTLLDLHIQYIWMPRPLTCSIVTNAPKNTEYVPHRNTVCVYYISCNVSGPARALCVEVPMSNSAQKLARENKTFCPDVLQCKIRLCIFLSYCTMKVSSWRGEVNTFYTNLLHFSGTWYFRCAVGRLSNLRNLISSSRKRQNSYNVWTSQNYKPGWYGHGADRSVLRTIDFLFNNSLS
jgi:hypothetical protein